MCGICGCGSSKLSPLKPHYHHHDDKPQHSHTSETHGERLIRVEQDILAKNDGYAERLTPILMWRGVSNLRNALIQLSKYCNYQQRKNSRWMLG